MMGRNVLARAAVAVAIVGLAATAYLMRPKAGEPAAAPTEASAEGTAAALPRLLDLGADRCVPCKMMAPILEELKRDYAGALEVEFVDVWKSPEAAQPYGLRVIPTQIFFAPDGTELFRHEGFYSREDILAKWRELGVALPDGEA